MVKITDILHGSLAEKAGIKTEDILISINGCEIKDVLDYRFYLADTDISVTVRRDESEIQFKIKKETYDDIGLCFDTPLMDKKNRCENKCIFCFIDQNPKGMRESIYFKDDDSRLSFLHGNYITLTNLDDSDIDRIIKMHISPVNISVHTTNPELRVRMMHNKRAGEVLKYLKILADAGISLRLQIVLCKGINDGSELDRTMNDLFMLYPSVESVSVVPAGLTGFRDGLYELDSFSSEECRKVIKQVNGFSSKCRRRTKNRIFFASDEFYVKSGIKLPKYGYYENFSQLDNGVGTLTLLSEEFLSEIKNISFPYLSEKRIVSVATGEASYDTILSLCRKLMSKDRNLEVKVYKVKNRFFGGEVTVTGLLTGSDLLSLKGYELGQEMLLSYSMLRSERDMFLDGMTPSALSEKLGVNIIFTECDGKYLVHSILGIKEAQ